MYSITHDISLPVGDFTLETANTRTSSIIFNHKCGKLWCKWRHITWWRHQMEKFSAVLALCAGNSPVTGEFPWQRPVTRSFDVFFDLRLKKRLNKQSRRRWFETTWRPLWRHRNTYSFSIYSAFIHASLPRWVYGWAAMMTGHPINKSPIILATKFPFNYDLSHNFE